MRNKTKIDFGFNNTKYLIFSLLFFTVAVFLETTMLKTEEYKIDNHKIETQLHKLEKQIDIIINDFSQIVKEKKYLQKPEVSTWSIDGKYTHIEESGFSILIYENDTLRYWTGNNVPAPYLLSGALFNIDKIIKSENAWYEVRAHNEQNFSIIGLIKIKNNYSYENKYLQNNFRKELEIPSSVKLSSIPVTQGKNIKDSNGDYVFSLVPVNRVNPVQNISGITAIMYFLSFSFLLLFINQIFLTLSQKKHSYFTIFGISLLLITARYFMIIYKFPFFFYSLNFFTPEIYAGNEIFPFLGDLLMNSMLLLFFAINIFRIFPVDKLFEKAHKKSDKFIYLFVSVLVIAAAFYLKFTANTIHSLVMNSNISFEIHKILEFNTFSLTAYLIIAILLSSYIVLTDRILKIFPHFVSFKSIRITLLLSIIFVAFLELIISHEPDILTYLLFVLITITITIIRFFKNEYNYLTLVTLILFVSVYTVIFISINVNIKEQDIQQALINQLIDERDDVAELLLHDLDKKLENDTVLFNKLINIVPDQKLIIYDYLNRKFFVGFWKKYKLTITLCGNSSSYNPANQADNCSSWYANELDKFGHKIDNTNFWFLDEGNGSITYLGFYRVPQSIDDRNLTIYIRLVEKLVPNILGYPELLIDESNRTESVFDKYSYAKYSYGELISKSGKFPYDLADKQFIIDSDKGFIEKESYRHFIFSNKTGTRIVLSKELPRAVDTVISFAYVFVLYNIIVILSILIINYKFLVKELKPDFKNKIKFSMILILFISFILFGTGTIFYANTQEKQIRNKEMTEKIQSVLTELEHKLNVEKKLTSDWKTIGYDHLDELLLKFSQVFFTDINLYDLDGILLATSRPEIFQKGLVGKQINQNAYTELALNGKAQFIQKESIGELTYSSIYIPLKNIENNVIAYINLPYFTSDNNLQKNISNLLITTINIYVVLFLLTILLAFIISNQITKPLRMLQNKFKAVQLGKKQQEIVYEKEDEVGQLVKEYNLMVTKLEESVRQLAESERESAWREMAKQIAHEIKNPLTPMKLSVQLLQRSWKDNKEDFEKRLQNVSLTLIEQIDTLSSIASEFSAFAKMPKPHDEEVDISAKLRTVIQLFENTKNISITTNFHQNDSVKIFADKEQLSRVFINIIKNGIQSIPEGVQGKIFVEVKTYGNNVKVTIEDNGSGIPDDRKDKLFQPSFTTKTKGMGMGLAIVKNIINNANGEIWFESEQGKGTKFFVEFPTI